MNTGPGINEPEELAFHLASSNHFTIGQTLVSFSEICMSFTSHMTLDIPQG